MHLFLQGGRGGPSKEACLGRRHAWAGAAGVSVKAVAYLEAQHALATSLKVVHILSAAAIDIVVTPTLHVRAARQGPAAAGDDQAPGPRISRNTQQL
jgi:hypothetical protein